jgi:hypothetical protein
MGLRQHRSNTNSGFSYNTGFKTKLNEITHGERGKHSQTSINKFRMKWKHNIYIISKGKHNIIIIVTDVIVFMYTLHLVDIKHAKTVKSQENGKR